MTMPGFTAVATLYKTSGHYTNRHFINLASQMGNAIGPALGISDEGPIEVHSCRPGLIQIGEGENMVCVDPLDPFGTGGHEGPGEGGTGGGVPTDTGGGSSGDDEVLISEGCTVKQIHSRAAKPCWDKQRKESDRIYYLRCVGDKMGCCHDYVGSDGKTHRDCTNLTPP
jgi:hypothetical protein